MNETCATLPCVRPDRPRPRNTRLLSMTSGALAGAATGRGVAVRASWTTVEPSPPAPAENQLDIFLANTRWTTASSRRWCGDAFDEQPQREHELEYERREPLVVSSQRPSEKTGELQGQPHYEQTRGEHAHPSD